MTADLVADLSDALERDIWRDLAASPPDPWLLADTCALAGQLKISGELTRRHGCTQDQAAAFVVQTDVLLHRIEVLGGFKLLGRSALATFYAEAAALADALIDCICAQ